MRSLSRALLAILTALLLAGTAEAQRARIKVHLPPLELPKPTLPVPENGTVWQCWFPGVSINCRLMHRPDPNEPGYMPASHQQLDPRLPEIVGTVRNYPELLWDEVVVIPLIGVPFDLTMAGQLAESVMCGNRSGCGVVFSK